MKKILGPHKPVLMFPEKVVAATQFHINRGGKSHPAEMVLRSELENLHGARQELGAIIEVLGRHNDNIALPIHEEVRNQIDNLRTMLDSVNEVSHNQHLEGNILRTLIVRTRDTNEETPEVECNLADVESPAGLFMDSKAGICGKHTDHDCAACLARHTERHLKAGTRWIG